MKRLIALLFLALATSPLIAKCSAPTITVSGTVVDIAGQPVAGVAVALSWVLRGKPQGPAQGQTDLLGRYDVPVVFNSFSRSSMFRGDVCKERVTEVSVSTYTPGYRAEPILVRVVALAAKVDLDLVPASP